MQEGTAPDTKLQRESRIAREKGQMWFDIWAAMQPAVWSTEESSCYQPSHGSEKSQLQLWFSWLLLEVPGWILSSWPRLAAFLHVMSPTCVTQPLLQQRFELAHILKAQVESLEAGNGGLAEIIAIKLPHGKSNVTLPEKIRITTWAQKKPSQLPAVRPPPRLLPE